LLNGTVGVAYSPTPPATLSGVGGSGTGYTYIAANLPPGLSIGPSTGLVSGTPTQAGSFNSIAVTVTDSLHFTATQSYAITIASAPSGPITINDPETVTVNDSLTQVQLVDVSDPEAITVTDIAVVTVSSPLAITGPASLPLGTLNVAYTSNASTTMTASGGTPPYNWTATGLPPGLSIGATSGTISGTPTAAGSATVVVTVTDSSSNTATKTYSLAVNPPLPPLAITSPSSLPNADLNASYSETLGATGGLPPYIWTATGLPAGLAISTGGVLSGTPAVAGVFPVTVTVTDSANNTNSVIYSLTVVAPGLGISASPPTLTIVQGQSGQTTITFTPVGGYPGPVTLSCTGLPANTLCSFTLLPSGTPITSPLTFNGQQVMVLLTIQTDVGAMATVQPAPAPTPLRPGAILTAIAFWFPGSMLGVIALRRKRKLFTKNPRSFGLCLCVLLVGTLAGLAGCISGGGFGTYVTPAGTSTVTVVATPGSGSPVTVNIGLTITQQ
jgi:hypothetical protein